MQLRSITHDQDVVITSDALIPLFSNRSNANVKNGRYQFDTDTLIYKCHSQNTGNNLI